MQWCNSGENARFYIGITSQTYVPVRPMSNSSFSVRHIFQFPFWPHRRNCHVILRQHATFHQYRITRSSRWRPLWRDFTSGFWLGDAPYWNYFSSYDFDHITVIRMIFWMKLPNFIHIGPPNAAAQLYFRFLSSWYHCIRKVKIYQQTKFRRHTSIRGWDITTSVLEK